jgi:DNA-binding transcriptional MocR family regulator
VDALAHARALSDRQSPTLDQAVLAEFIAEGTWHGTSAACARCTRGGLLLGFSAFTEQQLSTGVVQLAAALRDALSTAA